MTHSAFKNIYKRIYTVRKKVPPQVKYSITHNTVQKSLKITDI